MNNRQRAVAHTKAQLAKIRWVKTSVSLVVVAAVSFGLYVKFREQPTVVAKDFWEVSREWNSQEKILTHRGMEVWTEAQEGTAVLAKGFVRDVQDAWGPFLWQDDCRLSIYEATLKGVTLAYGEGSDFFRVDCEEVENLLKNEYVEVLCELEGEQDIMSDPRTEDCEVLP